jgi:small subunit ribosomal protein S17
MAQKRIVGKVVKKNGRTIVVKTERFLIDEKYGKSIKIFKTKQVHDVNEAAQIGNIVEIIECKPVSKLKTFSLNKVIE